MSDIISKFKKDNYILLLSSYSIEKLEKATEYYKLEFLKLHPYKNTVATVTLSEDKFETLPKTFILVVKNSDLIPPKNIPHVASLLAMRTSAKNITILPIFSIEKFLDMYNGTVFYPFIQNYAVSLEI